MSRKARHEARRAEENDAFTQYMARLISTVQCPTCMGRGWYLGNRGRSRCFICRGTGRVREGAHA